MDKKVTKQIKKYIDKDDVKSVERLLKRRLGKTEIDPVNICVIGERQESDLKFIKLHFCEQSLNSTKSGKTSLIRSLFGRDRADDHRFKASLILKIYYLERYSKVHKLAKLYLNLHLR